ncbi:MAG: hypothetical protein KTV77_05470 [Wolbachia endosymbiont of Fragariocoptes setiger]|nr:hypothetical protein [Wolbachia endosymbiont of Fragariocoptes setiger]
MNEGLNLLLQAIPDTDPNYNLKRIEVMRWHQFCGVKVLNEKSEYFVVSLLDDDTYWDGYKLKRTLLGENILNDAKNIMNNYDRYRFASLMCSKEKVREHFLKRSDELGCSVEDFVTGEFDKLERTELENFWSHYANIIDVESPSPIIIDSFKEMMRFQGFNYDSQSDIWKYGFWCAQVVGSVDAMDFFVNKLVKNREEKDQFLIDTIAKIKFGTVDIYSDDRTLEYCIEHLSPDKYKLLMEQEAKTRGCFTILGRLTEIHLYNYIKQLASCLPSRDIVSKDYCRLLYRIFHPKYLTINELNQQRNDLFLWLWNSETFKDQKLNYLNNLDKASQRSIMLKIIENNEFSLFKVIIDDANSHQIKIALKEGCSICKALYKKNQRSLLSQMFNSIENSDQFLVIADQLLFSHLNKTLSKNQTLCSKKVFDLYTTGNKDDLFKYIEAVFETKRDCYNPLIHDMDQLVSEVFYSMIEGKYNPQSIINFNDRVSSLLNEPSFTTNPQNRRI